MQQSTGFQPQMETTAEVPAAAIQHETEIVTVLVYDKLKSIDQSIYVRALADPLILL